MSYKSKHLHHLKHLVLGTVLAATTLGCSENKPQNDSTFENDMLTLNKISATDISGRTVTVEKSTIPVYRTADMVDEQYQQLIWAPRLIDKHMSRNNEKTRAVQLSSAFGDDYYVEVYDDGVLKAQPSLAVVKGKLVIIGDDFSYEKNLKKHRQNLYQETLQQQQKIEIARQKEEAKRRQREEAARRAAIDSARKDSLNNAFAAKQDSVRYSPDSMTVHRTNKGRE